MKNPFKHQFRVTQIQHSGHEAMDLVCDADWDVVATEDGVVTSSRIVTDKNDLTWTYGHYIKYRLKDGTYILCAHLSKRLVKVGDQIKKGQVIGVMGSTGNSDGAHLHIEHRAANGNTRLKVYDYLGIENVKAEGKEPAIEQRAETKPAAKPATKPAAKPATKPAGEPSSEIKEGAVVRIKPGAVYTNGVKVPDLYIGKDFTVRQHDDKLVRTLIKELNSWVADGYIETTDKKTPAKIGVNSRVKIAKGAVYTNGVKVPAECIGVPYTVMQLYADKALLREIYSWVATKYLTLI